MTDEQDTNAHAVKSIRSVRDLEPDTLNANKGTPRGRAMLETSLRRYGMGRSIVVDKRGRVIGGNKTLETAVDVGIENVVVVPSDGTKLVVVQRTDLDLDTDVRAKELAIADNRAGETGLAWDPEVLSQLQDQGAKLSLLWRPDELAELLGQEPPTPDEVSDAGVKHLVLITCRDEAHQSELLEELLAKQLEVRAVIA